MQVNIRWSAIQNKKKIITGLHFPCCLWISSGHSFRTSSPLPWLDSHCQRACHKGTRPQVNQTSWTSAALSIRSIYSRCALAALTERRGHQGQEKWLFLCTHPPPSCAAAAVRGPSSGSVIEGGWCRRTAPLLQTANLSHLLAVRPGFNTPSSFFLPLPSTLGAVMGAQSWQKGSPALHPLHRPSVGAAATQLRSGSAPLGSINPGVHLHHTSRHSESFS